MSNPFLTKVFHFNAAHQYGHNDWSAEKNWKVFGPDSKVHGHNYILDHSQFEIEVDWFKDKQPSTENLVKFIWTQIDQRLKPVVLHRIRLHETPSIFTDYYGPVRNEF